MDIILITTYGYNPKYNILPLSSYALSACVLSNNKILFLSMHMRHKTFKLIYMYFMYVTVWAHLPPKFCKLLLTCTLNFKYINKRITSSFAFFKNNIKQTVYKCISKPYISKIKLSHGIFCLAGSLPPVTTEFSFRNFNIHDYANTHHCLLLIFVTNLATVLVYPLTNLRLFLSIRTKNRKDLSMGL